MTHPPLCFPEPRIIPPRPEVQPLPRFKEEPTSAVEWFPDAPSEPRRDELPPLKLDMRGVTSQKAPQHPSKPNATKQNSIWSASVIHRNTIAAKLRSIGENQLADTLEECHSRFTIAVCKGCSKTTKFANRCDLFYCPQCAARLQREREEQVRWWANEVRQPKHVVLTVKNTATITATHIRRLRSDLTKLRRSKFASNWNGGFYRFEITNEGKGWHLHIHILVDALWVDQLALSTKWESITNGRGHIVKVMDVRNGSYLHEVTKYVVKGHQLAAWQPEQILQFINAFQGQRCFGVFGSLYGKRTEFAEWIAGLKSGKTRCACGSDQCVYYSETEWQILGLRLTPTSTPRPPPTPTTAELALNCGCSWPD